MSYKNQILQLRSQGKTYRQIVSIIGCSNGIVCYYCGENQQQKTLNRTRKLRTKQHPLVRKLENFNLRPDCMLILDFKSSRKLRRILYEKLRSFCRMNNKPNQSKPNITVEQLLQHVGDSPTCYLTGQPIDLTKSNSYQLDHIIPKAQGGPNTIDNLGLCSREANHAKYDMTPDQFLQLCKNVLEHNGYKVSL